MGWSLDFDPTLNAQDIFHGFFWPPPPADGGPADLGMFWYEFICMPRGTEGYLLSDGFGGFHAALLGFSTAGPGTPCTPSGNFNGTPGTSFGGLSEGLMPGEWGNVAYGYDSVGGYIYLYVNGIIVGKFAYAGTRYSVSSVTGGGQRFYIGGSDHANFNGRMQMYRGAEGGTFPFVDPENGYPPDRVLQGQIIDPYATGTSLRNVNIMSDLTYPSRVVTDLSSGAPAGYQGLIHPGSLHSFPSLNLDIKTLGRPTWVGDPNAPLYDLTNPPLNRLFYPPKAPPPGNNLVAFDSFGGLESSYFYTNFPDAGKTEFGGFKWNAIAPSSAPIAFGRRAYSMIWFAPTAGNCVIQDAALPTDFDMRIAFPGFLWPFTGAPGHSPLLTSLVFRFQDTNNYLWAAVLADKTITIGGGATWTGAGQGPADFPQNFTKMRITGVGNLLTLYVDDQADGWNQCFQTNDATLAGVKGFGMLVRSNPAIGTAPSQLIRWSNFTLYNGLSPSP